MSVAWKHGVPRGRIAPRPEAPVPQVGTTVVCALLDCSDFCIPDCVPEMLESVRDTKDGLPVAGEVVLPEMSRVMFAGSAAVLVSLPAITGVVSSAVFAGGMQERSLSE